MKLTKNLVFLHYFSKFMGILLFVLKYMYISLLLKMINGFFWPAKIMASPFKLFGCWELLGMHSSIDYSIFKHWWTVMVITVRLSAVMCWYDLNEGVISVDCKLSLLYSPHQSQFQQTGNMTNYVTVAGRYKKKTGKLGGHLVNYFAHLVN